MNAFVSLLREPAPLEMSTAPDGALSVSFDSLPGLCQFAVIADASDFNWDELYIDLHKYGNTGQRTGPWDFNLLDANKPLVPSYWVCLDGRRLGLWYFERVSLADVEAKRFRGKFAFHVASPGRHEITLEPYRPMAIRWLSAVLETDPEDRLEPFRRGPVDRRRRCPAGVWAQAQFWRTLRRCLETTHALYRDPLARACDWVLRKPTSEIADFPLLLAAHRLQDLPDAFPRLLAAIDAAVALPHWGNPREDGYGCDGDMGAMVMLRNLAWAVRALGPSLGEERLQRTVAKLRLQGQRFFDLTLLNRDYWGGSVIQDHGWKSLFGFGTASLTLLGLVPEAKTWVAYAMPRLRRSVAAIPRDGAIPPSSYNSLYLYLDELTLYRQTLLALGGPDIFDQAPFDRVIDYVVAVFREKDFSMIVANNWGNAVIPFIGGNAFLNLAAQKWHDGRAAYLQKKLVSTPEITFYHATQEQAYYHDVWWGLVTYDPKVRPVAALPVPKQLHVFEDSGLAVYRSPTQDMTFSVRCGPFASYTGYRRAPGPCDRLCMSLGAGHFVIALGKRVLLATPDSGYRLKSNLRTCMLVDGAGQAGDIGYTMSIPSFQHRGEEIQAVHWDPATGTGRVRLNLAPAYPEILGMAHYTREFLIGGGCLVCRDQVVFSQAHRLTWLFQAARADGIHHEAGLRYRFGTPPALYIEPRSQGIGLTAGVAETEVVWSYASTSGFRPFDHLRYDTTATVEAAVVDFVFTWDDPGPA